MQGALVSEAWVYLQTMQMLFSCMYCHLQSQSERPESGLPGLLVPDIPLEETGEIREAAGHAGLELVLLTTPTTSRKRMQAIAQASQGFVYLVSVTGKLFKGCAHKACSSLCWACCTAPFACTLRQPCSSIHRLSFLHIQVLQVYGFLWRTELKG